MTAARTGRKQPSIRTLWAIAKSPELHLTDEDLHAVVYRETGKESMKMLTQGEVNTVARVLQNMKDSVSRSVRDKRTDTGGDIRTTAQRRKIYALCEALGNPHHARQHSVTSPRNGERPGYNNLALTVKRVTVDHDGNPVRGVASNYVCDLKVGDKVQVVGPFGSSFLMPNHPRSHIVMICTGTGSAPMRAMTEWRRRLRKSGKFDSGKLLLFFGARTPQELPYFGPLQNLPKDFIDINFAFSRVAGQPRRYVQDAMRERSADLMELLRDDNTHIYVCGLKSMEEGVVLALRDVAQGAGLNWDDIGPRLKKEGRLHLETY